MILKDSYYDPVIDNDYEVNDRFFLLFMHLPACFDRKTRLNAQKGGKVSVFHSHSGIEVCGSTKYGTGNRTGTGI